MSKKRTRSPVSTVAEAAGVKVPRLEKMTLLRQYLTQPEVKSLLPQSIFDQLKGKADTLRFDSELSLGVAGRRGQSWADRPDSLRVYVAKRLGGALGDALSPFHVKVRNCVLPSEMKAAPSAEAKKAGGAPDTTSFSRFPLELWWQSAKMKRGESTEAYLKRRKQVYTAGVAKRSYYSLSKEGVQGAYFEGRVYQYVPSRAFYCTQYALGVEGSDALKVLRHLHRVIGVNLLLAGPDGFPLANPSSSSATAGADQKKTPVVINVDDDDDHENEDVAKQSKTKESKTKKEEQPNDSASYELGTIYNAYLDVERPFGHERVLYCLVRSQDKKEEDHPWVRYLMQNKAKQEKKDGAIVYPDYLE